MKYLFAILFSLCSLQLYAQQDVPPTAGFEIKGAVKKELKFSIADILRFPQDTLGDVVVRNHKGEPKITAKQMKGVLLKTLLDSAAITVGKPKEYSELCVVLIASDGYRNVYSWNELYNTAVGNRVYVITEMDGKTITDMPNRILVMSLADQNSGGRHLKGLAKVEVKKVQ